MKADPSITAIGVVMAVTVAATSFRVVTAPDRIQARVDSARSTCLSQGGEWQRMGRDDICVLPEPRKPD